jgi:hypothetical protein
MDHERCTSTREDEEIVKVVVMIADCKRSQTFHGSTRKNEETVKVVVMIADRNGIGAEDANVMHWCAGPLHLNRLI